MAEKSLTRAVTKSLAGAVPFVSDETRGSIDTGLARILLGLQGQVYGLNNEGKPSGAAWADIPARHRGKDENIPGVMNEVLSLPTLLPALAGLVASPDQVKWLEEHAVPDRSKKAAARQDQLTKLLRESAGLTQPKGFVQNAEEALGSMFGQLPFPGGLGKSAVQGAAKKSLKAAVGAVPEYVLPTIQPTLTNYAAGTIAGGALGALGNSDEEPQGYKEGGKVGIIAEALARLSELLQGSKLKGSEDINNLMYPLKEMEGVGTQKRNELTKIKLLRNNAEDNQIGFLTDSYNDRLLNQLAEIYLNPEVRPIAKTLYEDTPLMKSRGGKIGALHHVLSELHSGLQSIAPLMTE